MRASAISWCLTMTELPRMSDAYFRRAKKLIRKLCANCDGGNCLLLDDGEVCVCPQLISYTVLCRYFQTAVLPADRELYAEIMENNSGKKCASCGKPFVPRSNRALYCDRCRAVNERQRTRERVRRHRGIR